MIFSVTFLKGNIFIEVSKFLCVLCVFINYLEQKSYH